MSLDHYWEALRRLEAGKPIRVQSGYTINLNTVAVEAGRKPGSIKKSRASHSELIQASKVAAAKQREPNLKIKNNLAREKNRTKSYKQKLHEALNREVMHIATNDKLRKIIKANGLSVE